VGLRTDAKATRLPGWQLFLVWFCTNVDIFGKYVDIFGKYVDILGEYVDIFGKYVDIPLPAPNPAQKRTFSF
jgi:hypothetical protein